MSKSGKKVNYLLRPAKNVERKMMCEVFSKVNMFNVLSDYRYIGFGSFYFTDFILMHNMFGITKMISIEKDTNEERYSFNKPYGCIDLIFKDAVDALDEIYVQNSDLKDIIWLDYDDSIDENMLISFGKSVKNVNSGSIICISINPSISDKPSRIENILLRCGEAYIPAGIKEKELDPPDIHKVYSNIFNNVIAKSLYEKNVHYTEPEEELTYKQLFFYKYKDTSPMLTYGIIVLNKRDLEKFESLEILNSNSEEPCNISVPNLTYKEISAVNTLLPKATSDEVASEMKFLNKADIEQYKSIYRHYPNYMETYSFN